MDNIDKKVINIDYPCIQDIVIRKNETDVCFTIHDGQDETKLFMKDGQEIMFTVNIGDVSNIGFGGTDNWGKDRLPLNVGYTKGDVDYDSVYVDTIEIQQLAGEGNWCKCELINDNKTIKYTALSENPDNKERRAYFYHKTQDDTVKRGYNAGRPAAKEWCVTVIQKANPGGHPVDPTTKKDFETLVNDFNEVLPKSITKNSTTWNYLLKGFNAADDEWNNGTLGLFSPENYPEIYNYRGNNDQYDKDNTSYNAMQSWLMAMSLAEIIANKGTVTNNQTEVYKKAYAIGGGRNIPLYGNYTLKSDVVIARLVASVLWSKVRANYSFAAMDAMRNELGGSSIDRVVSWTNLESYSSNDIGYNVNVSAIFPVAAGPFATDVATTPGRTYPPEQPAELFNPDTKNYLIDEIIDKLVTDNYNVTNSNPEFFHRTVQAIADGVEETKHMLDNDLYYDYVVKEGNDYNFTKASASNNKGCIKGVFNKDVTGKDLSKFGTIATDTNESWLSRLLSGTQYISSFARINFLQDNYGRRRPGEGLTCASSRCDCDDLNCPLRALENFSITAIMECESTRYDADGRRYYVDKNGNGRYDNGEEYYEKATPKVGLYPNTYPSGHSAGMWAAGMLMMELIPDRAAEIAKAAYGFTVSRTIVRYHWNSDIMYGKLIASMLVPIVHNFRDTTRERNDFRSIYNNAKANVYESSGDWEVNLIIKNETSNPIQSTGEIRLYVDDHIGVDTYLPGAAVTAGALYTFNVGINDFSDKEVHCVMHGDPSMDDSYNGKAITEARFYDYRHYNNTDAGFDFILDTNDSRCDKVLKKTGATYVLKITDRKTVTGKISVKFTNKTGQEIRFSGKFLPYIQEQEDAIDLFLCPPNKIDNWCHYAENPYVLKNGASMIFEFTDVSHYSANNGQLNLVKESISNYFGKHFRIADSAPWPTGIAAIKFCAYNYDRSSNEYSTSAAMIHAIPIPESNCLIKNGGVYEITLDKIKDNATLDRSYATLPYTGSDGEIKYVIM